MTWFRPAGSLRKAPDPVHLTPEDAGWAYSGLQVLTLAAGERRRLRFAQDEVALIPLSGSHSIDSEQLSTPLEGRRDVFDGATDRVYLPVGAHFDITARSEGEIAIATARAKSGGEAMYLPAEDTAIELRGSGQASRQIHELLSAERPGPERLIVVEVLTPGGNWSSYPPHKHDEWGKSETPLEEIYYFRIQGDHGFGFHRTYTADHTVDDTLTVRDGDVYLIPRGYHGPCVAAPGYDMYYLNVMAGPERAWLISTDTEHEWVTRMWTDTQIDPRLPLGD